MTSQSNASGRRSGVSAHTRRIFGTFARRNPLILGAFTAVTVLCLAAGAWSLYDSEIRRLLSESSEVLRSVAHSRATKIEHWRSEALAAAEILSRHPLLAPLASGQPGPSSDPGIAPLFSLLRQGGPYSDVEWVDSSGRILFSLSGRTGNIEAPEMATLSAARRSTKPVLSPLILGPAGLRLSVVAPILSPAPAPPRAFCLFQFDTQTALHSALSASGHGSGAEAWLVSRESGVPLAVRAASPQRSRAALLHIASAPGEISSILASLSRAGVLDAPDHRGVRRLAASAPVGASPWSVVVRFDRDVSLSGWQSYALVVACLFAALLAALAIFLAWRRRARLDAEALVASQHRYQLILQTALDGFVLTDAEGAIVEANESYSFMLGLPRDLILGRNLRDFDASPFDDFFTRKLCDVLAGGHVRFESRHRRYDGALIDLDINVHRLPGSAGLLVFFLRDFTARKRAEQSLQDSEHRLTQALHVANIGIFDHDHADAANDVSRNMQMFLTPGSTEVPTFDLVLGRIHPDDLKTAEEALFRSHDPSGDGIFDLEHRLLLPGGAVRWVHTRAQTFFRPVAGFLRPARTIGATIETTSLHQAQEDRERLRDELLQAQKLDSIGRLAGGVAHEFNNLLTIINGSAELLLGRLPAHDVAHRLAGSILTAGNRAADLCAQLLAVGRKQLMRPATVNLNEVVLQVRSLLGDRFGPGICLRTTLDENLDHLEADQDQLLHAVMNLVLNARDALSGSGTIEISTANLEIPAAGLPADSRRLPGRYVTLTVSDNGAGMPPEVLDKIFEPFFTTKARGQGTGLGLASVHGIVEQNNGWIDVRSEVGSGTSFQVFLPSHPKTPPAVSPPSESDAAPSTLLVVEDQAPLLDLALTMLRAHGYTVLGATSGQDALHAAAAFPGQIHLLLTDHNMPGMRGDELALRLRQARPDIRLLFMTGYSTTPLSGAELLDDPGDILLKPFREKTLIAMVAQVLNRQVPA